MKKTAEIVVLLVLALAVLPGAADAKKLKVVATLPDLASIARSVGGDRVDVSSIALGIQDPHYLEAKPSYQVRLSRADLLIYNGLELEIGWLPLLVRGSRNPKLAAGAAGSLDASEAVKDILEVPVGEVDRGMGDVHPQGNPHYLLDPRNGVRVAALVRDRMKKLDPEGSMDYDKNYSAFESMMNKKIESWEKKAAVLQGKAVVAYHKQWEYLADWLGFEIVEYVENKPGIPPSPRHRAFLVDMIRSDNIMALLTANYNPSMSKAKKVAEEGGIPLVELPAATGGEDGIDEYADLIGHIVDTLVNTAEG